jgi:Fe-S cluster assembly scaffold protein SufB
MELSTYFRINQAGQFERTLLIADEGSYVVIQRLQPSRDENQLHAAVVELDDAEIKYSTVQNWYPGNKEGKGGFSIL